MTAVEAVSAILRDGLASAEIGDTAIDEEARKIVRAVLTAIREPTDIMAFKGGNSIAHGDRLRIRREKAVDVWTAMIDAALASN